MMGSTVTPTCAWDVFDFVGHALSSVEGVAKNMKATSLGNGSFSLSGICPYPDCNRPTIFATTTAVNVGAYQLSSQNQPWVNRVAAIMQCQGCQRYILALVWHPQNQSQGHTYLEHFPMGSPDQMVADEVPQHIKEDFQEALRCIFVNAYNATAEMCRRALEAACLDLGAPKNKVLEKMIDWLEENRIITPYLKDAAHKVRLGGNRGAHPNPDGPPAPQAVVAEDAPVEKIQKEHADAIIAFTREFFHHVYVGPKLLGKYDFSKPKTAKA